MTDRVTTEREGTEREKFRRAELELAPLRKFIIEGLDKDGLGKTPYLTRHHLLENPDGSQILLHQIHRSDEDREFHDHPWAFRSFIVSGAYVEHTPVFLSELGYSGAAARAWAPGASHQRVYRAGDWNVRMNPAEVHRVDVIEHPCITVVYRGPRVRDWGFLMQDGRWVPHRKYLEEKFGAKFETEEV